LVVPEDGFPLLTAGDGLLVLTVGEGSPFVLSLSKQVMAVRAELVEARKKALLCPTV
jgi:hypothetical protein